MKFILNGSIEFIPILYLLHIIIHDSLLKAVLI
jgi:hypothetical protein